MVVEDPTFPETKEEIDNDHHTTIYDADKNTKKGANRTDDCIDDELKIEESPNSIRNKNIKKAGVAVAGGALITAGIPLIPVLCAGELMIIGGMALLATEFDSAKNILDKGREKLTQFALKDDEDANSKSNVDKVDEKVTSSDHEKILLKNDHGKEINFPINKKNDVDQKLRNVSKKVQRSLRTMVKKDILPIIDKFAPKEEEKCHKKLI